MEGRDRVGDDAQAIYSFRAAAVENILGFADRYTPKAEIVVLARITAPRSRFSTAPMR